MKFVEQASSCIAVFSEYDAAKHAVERLLAVGVDPQSISVIGETSQEGEVAQEGLQQLDADLMALGVQDANLHCYKCLIYGGSWLVIVSGTHTQVSQACDHLEKHPDADVSLHFNAPADQAVDEEQNG